MTRQVMRESPSAESAGPRGKFSEKQPIFRINDTCRCENIEKHRGRGRVLVAQEHQPLPSEPCSHGSAHTALQEPLCSVLSMHRSRAVLRVEEFHQHRSKDLCLDFVGLTFQGTMLAVGDSLRQRYCCGIHEGE